MKINIGAGAVPLEGYVNLDRKSGDEAFPLQRGGVEIADGSVEEIRASHVLEHFPSARAPEVVNHWAAKLKPGGVLKIAVPNFAWCAKAYLDGVEAPIEGYVLGGQTDADDFHQALFDERTLVEYLRAAGLTDIGEWYSDAPDCSRLPVSLNLRAVKPVPIAPGSFKVAAIMSMPRLGFTDNFMCAQTALNKLGIELRSFVGPFWGQYLETGLETLLAEGVDAVLTIDWDTVFTAQNVSTLMRLMLLHPEADAICPLQSARGWSSPLLTMELPDGAVADRVPKSVFDADLTKLRTGHFGLTLIRASSLAAMPKPWFWSTPAKDGGWGDGHVDEDIYFWRRWAEQGKTLFNANRVVVGHCELMVKWPGRDLNTIHQRVVDFWTKGPPTGVWK
jgi:hypothetical protein